MFGDEDEDELSVAKESLMTELGDGLSQAARSGSARKVDRELAAELVLQLEKLNPTANPATSPLVNGKWKFVYASASTPGLASLRALLKLSSSIPNSPTGAPLVDVGEVSITIQRQQPRVEAAVRVRVLSLENTIKLYTTLEAKTVSVMQEAYAEVESQLGGERVHARNASGPRWRPGTETGEPHCHTPLL